MKKSKRIMRRLILSKLFDLLEDRCTVSYTRETFIGGDLSHHDLDALLAFKSDPRLNELRSALDRLESGTFGICLGCKSVIAQESLDNDPTLRLCSACEQKFIHSSSLHHFQQLPV